jgi:single-strand DNA-binding protein
MVNKVVLLGNVGTEVKVHEGNTKVASFALATTERYNRDGQTVENTEWHKIISYGKLAEFVSNYVHKGKQMYVEGKIKTRSYEDENGVQRTITEIIANEIKLCGKKDS